MASPLSASRAAPLFQVQVLGPFALQRDDTPVDVGRWQPRVATLFKLLVTAPGHRRSRDELIDLLWPDAIPEVGAGNLRMVVHRLRQSLGSDPSPVLSEHGWVALNPAYTWELDLERFEGLTCKDDMVALEEAARLYRGEPLEEDRYEDWAAPIREETQRRWSAICLRLAQLYRARGSQEDAALWLERLLEREPLHEQALQELLSILGDLGRRTEALRRYRQFEQLLSEEMDVPPEPETLALVARLEGYLRQAAVAPAPETQIVPVIPLYPLISVGSLVGREEELVPVLRALPPRDADVPRLVLFAAEAGTGKTRMLAETAWRARDAGVLTLAGSCYEQESRLPYGPIHDALADYVRTEPECVLRAQLEAFLPELAQIVPEVRTRLGGEPPVVGDTGGQRLALFATVSQVFERISQDTPLVLLLDDLHWADDVTLQLLHYLLRQPALDRMLIVGAYRQEEVSENEPLLQLETERHGAGARFVHVISLAPLQEQELGAFVEGRMRDRCALGLVQSLYTRSGGNPFFADQMLRLLEQEKQLELGEEGWHLTDGVTIELPVEVRETVARRLRRLDPDEQEVLRLGAVLGRDFSFPALEAMWERDERSLFAALDAAQASYVLRETEGGYSFRHPLLREVVYDRAPVRRRTRLHQRAAAELEILYGDRRGEHAAELAWHALHGENREQAVRYSILAGEQAASLYAYAEAEQHFRTALGLLAEVDAPDDPAGEDVRLKAMALEKLGALLKTVGQYGEAIRLLRQAVERYAVLGDLDGQRRAVAHSGRVHLGRGTVDEGLAELSAALDRLGGGTPSPGLAALHLSLAFLLFRSGRYAEQLETAECAAELSRSSGDRRLFAEAMLVRAYALPYMSQQRDESRDFGRALEEVVRLAEEIGDVATLSRALCALGPYFAEKGELEAARRYLSRAMELAERLGDRSRIAFIASTCGFAAYLQGEWDEAQAFFERSLAIYTELDALPDSLAALSGMGQLAIARGDWETGIQYLEEHVRNAESAGDFRWLHRVAIALAERDSLEGCPESARNRLEQLCEHRGLYKGTLLDVQPGLAEAYLEMGDIAGAEQIASRAVQQARAADVQTTLVEALRVCGRVRSAQEHWEEAEQRFREALDLAGRMPCPYAAGRTLFDYGTMLIRQGRWEAGKLRLEEARRIFQALGARPFIERTDHELVKTGER